MRKWPSIVPVAPEDYYIVHQPLWQVRRDQAEDVSHAIAQEILRRLGLEGRNVPSELEDFIDRHVGRDRQLTRQLAY
jgi:hypothetical protein